MACPGMLASPCDVPGAATPRSSHMYASAAGAITANALALTGADDKPCEAATLRRSSSAHAGSGAPGGRLVWAAVRVVFLVCFHGGISVAGESGRFVRPFGIPGGVPGASLSTSRTRRRPPASPVPTVGTPSPTEAGNILLVTAASPAMPSLTDPLRNARARAIFPWVGASPDAWAPGAPPAAAPHFFPNEIWQLRQSLRCAAICGLFHWMNSSAHPLTRDSTK